MMKETTTNTKHLGKHDDLLKIPDHREVHETVPIGSVVATYAHPFTDFNTDILVTSYAHFTPPMMIVAEKKYGPNHNVVTGEKEDNDSYKCIYYSTVSGSLVEDWFKRKELKLISAGDIKFSIANKNRSIEDLKKTYLGSLAILSSVDLELKKKKMWTDSIDGVNKLKIGNQLDYLPPLGTIIDFRLVEDYQKYNDKSGKIVHRRSKLSVKLRWLNNNTGRYSQEYFPITCLKVVEREALKLEQFELKSYYAIKKKITLQENDDIVIVLTPLKFYDVIWKHYFYIYRFKNCFSGEFIEFKHQDLKHVIKIDQNPLHLDLIFQGKGFEYRSILGFFREENKNKFEGKWFEIEYADKNERYTKRIIYIDEFLLEKTEGIGSPQNKEKRLIKANCLLRNGEIRHFNVSRIKSYRGMPKEFFDNFVSS